MVKKQQLIKEKLKKFPPDVQELASQALEYAETMPEKIVTEQLKGIVRRIIKDKEALE